MTIDNTELNAPEMQQVQQKASKKTVKKIATREEDYNYSDTINCLRNEKVTVKYIPREKTGITDPKHPYYGGLADNATVSYTVPILRNGTYVDPLTKEEKRFLEEYMGLEVNAMSVHLKENNFWDNYRVMLSKTDTILDLSTPDGYIRYKVLLANRDYVAPSLEALRETPLETYRFVIVSDTEVYSKTVDRTNTKSKCWKEFGKVEDDFNVLRCIVETLEARPITPNTKIEFLREKCDRLIEADGKRFLSVITDPLLKAKVLIRRAVDEQIVTRRGDYYYYKNEPMCNKNEDPTFTVAAKWVAAPKNQEIKFSIEAELK